MKGITGKAVFFRRLDYKKEREGKKNEKRIFKQSDLGTTRALTGWKTVKLIK